MLRGVLQFLPANFKFVTTALMYAFCGVFFYRTCGIVEDSILILKDDEMEAGQDDDDEHGVR
jgi:hypothetical protein